jgi:hypothetical protein
MSVKMRQKVEREISTALIRELLRQGFHVSVDNGEEETKPMAKESAILAAMFQCDEDRLYAWRDADRFGWVYLVYGNDGWDVISDYTVNLECAMGPANKVADQYE